MNLVRRGNVRLAGFSKHTRRDPDVQGLGLRQFGVPEGSDR